MQEGSLIFLTKRPFKLNFRWFMSQAIASLTKFKGQDINDAKVHSAIIYRYKNILYVRDMDKKGAEHFTLDSYIETYKGRGTVLENPYSYSFTYETLRIFNISCRNTKVKYDYINTFVFQLIKTQIKKFLGWNSEYRRMCAEDASKQYNLLERIFKTPEKTNPNEMFKFLTDVKEWKNQTKF
jgi:hypothetical protein